MPARTDARSTLGDLVLHARTLALHLEVAEAAQWTPCPRPEAPERQHGRSRSARPSDPTAEVALDEARLALRRVVRDGEATLAEAVARLAGSTRRLEVALNAWYGGAPTATAPETRDVVAVATAVASRV
ncbi:hypothetical protein [Cellulomonas sp. C5510]|uniref:DUF7169 domain-containing protein n=1 Tax=Cellulomonas sp. C5510 TaxID=2871170 RepID=UPI001C9600AA|nr:hypothetical protein [Cellulomonas sp. C5510]QZN86598.1 hypothetical protein K5O09_05475 [Cellulomonas sp. C5510]